MTEKAFDIIEHMRERDKAGDFEYFKNSIMTDIPEVRIPYHRVDKELNMSDAREEQLINFVQTISTDFVSTDHNRLLFSQLAPGRAMVFAGHALDHRHLAIDPRLFTSCWGMGFNIHAPRQVAIHAPGPVTHLHDAFMQIMTGRATGKTLGNYTQLFKGLYITRNNPISIYNRWKGSISIATLKNQRRLKREAKQLPTRKYLRKSCSRS